MKLASVIAAAIFAYTTSAAPAATPPPASSTADLTGFHRESAQSFDDGSLSPVNFPPIPLSLAPDGIVAPGPLKPDTTASGLPFHSHPDNLENFPTVYPDTMLADAAFNIHPPNLQRSGQGNATAANFMEDIPQQFGEDPSANILERSPMDTDHPYEKYAKHLQTLSLEERCISLENSGLISPQEFKNPALRSVEQKYHLRLDECPEFLQRKLMDKTRAKSKITARATVTKLSNPSPDIEVRRQETLRKSEEYRCRLLWDVDDVASSMQGSGLLNPLSPAFWHKHIMTKTYIPLAERFTNMTLEQCAPMEPGNGIAQLRSHSKTNRCRALQDVRDVAYQWGDGLTPPSASKFFKEAEKQAGIKLEACYRMQGDRN